MEVSVIGIAGAGTMGHGIAQIAAQAGYYVLLYDSFEEALAKARVKIEASLNKFVEKGQMISSERDEVLARISFTGDLSEFDDADLIIEAVYEDQEVKENLFRELARAAKPECILASTTSSIPIFNLAAAAGYERWGRVVGMHFMNPPQLVPLLEIVRHHHTSDETVEEIRRVAERMKRNPIIESPDRPGFVVNRILMRAINEAAKIVGWGVDPDDVDKSVIIGVGSSKGMPILQLADLIGIDVCLQVLKVIASDFGMYSDYKPASILEEMVRRGDLGRKTGRGFFDYQK
jgi:3-hydroxybutyryl-CoA dehydrogenase